jgi:hypothetical protein
VESPTAALSGGCAQMCCREYGILLFLVRGAWHFYRQIKNQSKKQYICGLSLFYKTVSHETEKQMLHRISAVLNQLYISYIIQTVEYCRCIQSIDEERD